MVQYSYRVWNSHEISQANSDVFKGIIHLSPYR
jgi:hypothetical protein